MPSIIQTSLPVLPDTLLHTHTHTYTAPARAWREGLGWV
jgi:hypothetical protein